VIERRGEEEYEWLTPPLRGIYFKPEGDILLGSILSNASTLMGIRWDPHQF